jgi:hypothetical protein
MQEVLQEVRLGQAHGRASSAVPASFTDSFDRLNVRTPFYGAIVRDSDGQHFTARIDALSLAGDGTIEGCIVVIDLFHDGRTRLENRVHEQISIPLTDIREIRFYRSVAA